MEKPQGNLQFNNQWCRPSNPLNTSAILSVVHTKQATNPKKRLQGGSFKKLNDDSLEATAKKATADSIGSGQIDGEDENQDGEERSSQNSGCYKKESTAITSQNSKYNCLNFKAGSVDTHEDPSNSKDNERAGETKTNEKFEFNIDKIQNPRQSYSICESLPALEKSQQPPLKQFQFTSFVMEPNKSQTMTMKKRDKTKPLIDLDLVNRQLNIQQKLLKYQKQMNQTTLIKDYEASSRLFHMDESPSCSPQRSVTMNEQAVVSPSKRRRNKTEKKDPKKVVRVKKEVVLRGNMGLCNLDMSLVNHCGIPSLWITAKDLLSQGATINYQELDGTQVTQFMPYIKPLQKKLIRKQMKMLELIKFHKLFENEKYFGRTMNNHGYFQGNSVVYQDYYYFTTDFLKDNSKYKNNQNEFKQAANSVSSQPSQGPLQIPNYSCLQSYLMALKEKPSAFQLLSGQYDFYQPEMPVINDPESATFKMMNADNKILKHILNAHGIQQTDQSDWNILWTSVSLQNKPQIYENLTENQKINHFQNSTELTRKDRMADNIQKMKIKFGSSDFDFFPETYQLPDEYQLFQKRFNQIKKQKQESQSQHQILKEKLEEDLDDLERENLHQDISELEQDLNDNYWIVKPSQSSQGKGIYIVDSLSEIPQPTVNHFAQPSSGDKTVVSRYISNPLLINNHKFDLRIYVLLTSIDPLKIYVYNEGLVRFASEPYNNQKGKLKNLYSHLTNYSINKKSNTFQQNKSVLERDHGNKWSLSALQTHLENLGINMQPIWERIYDGIIKSILSVEHCLQSGSKKSSSSFQRSSCFELLGFDILLDSNFKPHLLEVNFSPSLSADSPLDYHIKSNLLVDTLNIVGIKRNPKRKNTNYNAVMAAQKYRAGVSVNQINSSNSLGYSQVNQVFAQRIKDQTLSKKNSLDLSTKKGSLEMSGRKRNGKSQLVRNELRDFTYFLNNGGLDSFFLEKLSKINSKHRDLIYETLDEFSRNRNLNYTCIFPAPGCHQYEKFFTNQRPSNQLIWKFLFQKNEIYNLIKQVTDYQMEYLKFETDYLTRYADQEEEEESDEEEDVDDNEDQDTSISIAKVPPEPKAENMNKDIAEFVEPPPKPAEENELKTPLKTNNNMIDSDKAETDTVERKTTNKKISGEEQIGIKEDDTIIEDEDSKIKDDTSSSDESPPFTNLKSSNLASNVIGQVRKDESPTKLPVDNKPKDQTKEGSKPMDVPQKQTTSQLVQQPKTELVNTKPLETHKQIQPLSPKVISQVKSPGKIESPKPKPSEKQVDKPQKKPVVEQRPDLQADSQIKPSRQITQLDQKQLSEKLESKETEHNMNQTKQPPEEPSLSNKEDQKEQKEDQAQNEEQKPNQAESKAEEQEKPKEKQKMIITGDDILIEYVTRITLLMDSIIEQYHLKFTAQSDKIDKVDVIVPLSIKQTLEKFIKHKIWSNKILKIEPTQKLNDLLKIRLKEMIDRRFRILKSQLKKQNTGMSQEEMLEHLKTQDKTRDKIVNKISSSKIEKMVKQSNVENKIDIVSILVDGQYVLPSQMTTSSGKQVIKGTLQSLKLFEKIIKQTEVEQLKMCRIFPHLEAKKHQTNTTLSNFNKSPMDVSNALMQSEFVVRRTEVDEQQPGQKLNTDPSNSVPFKAQNLLGNTSQGQIKASWALTDQKQLQDKNLQFFKDPTSNVIRIIQTEQKAKDQNQISYFNYNNQATDITQNGFMGPNPTINRVQKSIAIKTQNFNQLIVVDKRNANNNIVMRKSENIKNPQSRIQLPPGNQWISKQKEIKEQIGLVNQTQQGFANNLRSEGSCSAGKNQKPSFRNLQRNGQLREYTCEERLGSQGISRQNSSQKINCPSIPQNQGALMNTQHELQNAFSKERDSLSNYYQQNNLNAKTINLERFQGFSSQINNSVIHQRVDKAEFSSEHKLRHESMQPANLSDFSGSDAAKLKAYERAVWTESKVGNHLIVSHAQIPSKGGREQVFPHGSSAEFKPNSHKREFKANLVNESPLVNNSSNKANQMNNSTALDRINASIVGNSTKILALRNQNGLLSGENSQKQAMAQQVSQAGQRENEYKGKRQSQFEFTQSDGDTEMFKKQNLDIEKMRKIYQVQTPQGTQPTGQINASREEIGSGQPKQQAHLNNFVQTAQSYNSKYGEVKLQQIRADSHSQHSYSAGGRLSKNRLVSFDSSKKSQRKLQEQQFSGAKQHQGGVRVGEQKGIILPLINSQSQNDRDLQFQANQELLQGERYKGSGMSNL